MSRSTKKGPYVDQKLAKKIEAANKSGSKEVISKYLFSCSIIFKTVYNKFSGKFLFKSSMIKACFVLNF